MRRPALRRPPALVIAIAPVVAVAIAFYVWTAATSASLNPGSFSDPYNELVDGFSKGHLYLPITPDPRLARLADPYNPDQNGPILDPALRDVVYHDNRFYIYWGPAPALLAFWPFRALGLGDLPPGLAVLLFSVVGLLCALGVLAVAVRRYLPATPAWMVGVAAAALAFGSMLPWLLRRPESYEVAIAAGFCFFWAGVLLLLTAIGERLRPWRAAAAGLSFGLAFASRPPLGIGAAFAAGILVWLQRSGRLADRRALLRWAAILLGPAAACVVAVAIYNSARFGSPGDFGTTQMLAGSEQDRFFSLAYVPPGLWLYLLYPVRVLAAFPFFWVNNPHIPFPHTSGYDAAEKTAGLLPTVPFVLLLGLAWWALRRSAPGLRWIVLAAVATGSFLMVFTSWFYWGSVMRYQADWGALFIVAAALVWFAFATGRRRRPRRASAVTGTILAAVTVVVCAAISLIGSDDRLRMLHPKTFDSLQSFFSPVSALFADGAGHPILASVGGNPLDHGRFFLGTGPYPAMVVSARRGTATLEATLRRTPNTPRRAKLLVQARSPDGSTFSVPVRGGEARLPLSVRRGSNPFTLQVFADPPTGIPPYADSIDDGAIQVDGLRVR